MSVETQRISNSIISGFTCALTGQKETERHVVLSTAERTTFIRNTNKLAEKFPDPASVKD